MNDFVDPKHRGVNLSPGFKDLNDVLTANKTSGVSGYSTRWEDKRFSTHGLTHAAEYVQRLLESKSKKVVWLTFLPKRGEVAFMLYRRKDSCKAVFILEPDEEILEKRVREIFAEFDIVPFSDEPAAAHVKRVVSYSLPNSFPDFATIIIELLRQVYGVSDSNGLAVMFRER